MSKEEQFNSNVLRWAPLYPDAAEQLKSLDCQHTFFCETVLGEPNLCKEEQGQIHHYHSAENAWAEAKRWFAQLDLDKVSVLYVYGIGLGYYYEAAKGWLQEEDHYMVFLENDLEVIHRFFETERATQFLQDPRVRLCYFSHFGPLDPMWGSLTQLFGLRVFRFSALEYYARIHERLLLEIQSSLEFWENITQAYESEHEALGQPFYANFYRNISLLPHAHRANALFHQFEKVPAIICGAGPSLDKNIEFLKTLKDRALIFAGGTSMNALNSRGFLPHFGLGIDPNPAQLTRLIMNTAFETPFLYRNRLYHEALRLVQAPTLYVTGTGGYRLSNWLEGQLGISGEDVSEGFNVINFSLSLAYAFGCNPIIFVGVDLAYSGGQSYFSGVESHPLHERRRDFRTKWSDEDLLVKPDIFGMPVNTLWKWISESVWLSQFARDQTNVLFINATEGGIGMQGIPNKPLSEVAHYLLPVQQDLNVRVHGEIQNAQMPSQVTLENIRKAMEEMYASLQRCLEICKQLVEITLAFESDEEKQRLWNELTGEIAYEYILRDLDEYFQPAMKLDLQQLAYEHFITPANKEKNARLQADHYRFLSNAVLLNSAFIQLYVLHLASQPVVLPIVAEKPSSHMSGERYALEQGVLTIIDPELDLMIREPTQKSEPERLYYSDGSCKLEQYYSKGMLHGPTSYFASDGKLLAQSWYVKGVQQGKAWYYYHTGDLYSVQRYRDGKWNGIQQYYHINGQIKTLVGYHRGVLEGDVWMYDVYGRPKRELHFTEGKRNGVERMWNDSGLLVLEAEFREGQATGRARTWHPNGTLSQEVVFDDHSKVVSALRWNSDGVVVEEPELDYFEAVTRHTNLLTHSLENVVDEMGKVMPLLKISGETQSILKDDMVHINEDIVKLQQMGKKLFEEAVEGDNVLEPIWKTPATHRELQDQMAEITMRLSKEIDRMRQFVTDTSSRIDKTKDKEKKEN